MKKQNKIGTVFLASLLALAGLGVSYAGFLDTITVYATVNTGTVELDVIDYSGTWVYKDWLNNEWVTVVTHDPDYEPTLPGFLVAYAKAYAGGENDPYDVYMEWDNIFPCIDFMADIVVKYTGSIPAHVTVSELYWGGYVLSAYTTFYAYINPENTVDWPVQMHEDDTLTIKITIHLLQDNDLQGKSGWFGFNINAIQWNDECDQTTGGKQLSLPPGNIKITFTHPYTDKSYWKETLSMVPPGEWSPPIANNADLLGWCVDETYTIPNGATYWCSLTSSYDPMNPWPDLDWPYVNYIINHKGTATPTQIQNAIWYFIDGGYTGTDPVVWALIYDALANDDGMFYYPGAGSYPNDKWIAVVVEVDYTQHGYHQYTFIEVDP